MMGFRLDRDSGESGSELITGDRGPGRNLD